MESTLGFHYVKSCYGLWLPGDDRGSWSAKWDEEIGFSEPHRLHPGDPVRKRMAEERMKHRPVALDAEMMLAVERAIGRCAAASPWKITAGSIEPTQIHLLFTNSRLDVDRTLKWLAQEMTKAVHRETEHRGPVWSDGYWCSVIHETSQWENVAGYIERHNVRRGERERPYRRTTGWY